MCDHTDKCKDTKIEKGKYKCCIKIRKPGKYYFCGDVEFYAHCKKKVAILICSDDVTLDLKGFTLRQSDDVLGTIGIKVLSGHSNVHIINGKVENFKRLGVYIEGGNKFVFLGNKDSPLILTKNGGGTATSFGSEKEHFLEGGLQLGETNFWANQGFTKYKGPITSANLENCFIDDNYVAGAYFGNGTNYKLANSSFSHNHNSRVNGSKWGNIEAGKLITSYGFVHISLPNEERLNGLVIDNCAFDFNDSDGFNSNNDVIVNSYGLFHGGAKNVVIVDSRFNSNKSTNASSTALSQTSGYHNVDGECITISNSEAWGNSGPVISSGFSSEGVQSIKTIIIQKCNATGNVSDYKLSSVPLVSQLSAGIVLTDVDTGIKFIDCNVDDNKVIYDPQNPISEYIGFSIGLGVAGVTDGKLIKNVLIKGCNAANNASAATNEFAGSLVNIGVFVFENVTNLVLEDCVVQDHGSNFSTKALSVGLGILGKRNPDFVPSAVFKTSTVGNNAIGLYLDKYSNILLQSCQILNSVSGVFLTDVNCSVIKDNTFMNNTIAVLDETSPSTNTVSNNHGYNNLQYDVNYTSGPVPVLEGTLQNPVQPFPNYPPNLIGENVEIRSLNCLPVPAVISKFDVEKTMDVKIEKFKQFFGHSVY